MRKPDPSILDIAELMTREPGTRPGYIDAIEAQTNLVRWWDSQEGKDYGARFLVAHTKSDGWSNPTWISQTERDFLRLSDPYWVSEEMTEVIRYASQSMKPEPLVPRDLPTTSGFAYFEGGIPTLDIRGRMLKWCAVRWTPVRFGTRRSDSYVSPESSIPESDLVVDFAEQYPMYQTGRGLWLSFYSDPTDTEDELWREQPVIWERFSAAFPRTLSLMHLTPWTWGHGFDAERVAAALPEPFSMDRRFLAAFWHLISRPISVQARARSDRQTWRQAKRVKIDFDDIKVVTLRKALHKDRGPEREGDSVEWSCRWIVDWHWHTYHTKEGTKQIYMAPYVKGPPDKPLIVKDRVYKVTR